MIISFCGHSKFEQTKEAEQKILSILEKFVSDQPAELYLGDHGEFDSFAFYCCKKFKREHPNVSLVLITPYITPEYQKNHLAPKSSEFDGIIYPPIEDKPLRFAIVYRNRWIVDVSDIIICAVSHNFGGAYQTYRYAKQRKKKIINVAEQQG